MDGLDELVARRVRELMTEQGLRQVDMASGLTGLGFDWTSNRVAQVVTGRRPLSLLETAAVCEVLGTSVTGLLGPPDEVPLPTTGYVVTVDELAEALARGGGPWKARQEDNRRRAAKLQAHHAWVAEATQAYGEVHAKAARRLGITPEELEAASLRLWGRSLGLERDTRADAPTGPSQDRALQERRRIATRQLMRELREHLAASSGKATS